ncbi:MAG: DNA-directed RNA polymerase subunit beta' [Microgenomates group bacterium]
MKLIDFKSLRIKLASPETIKQWSHGEVLKPETINYRTFKPEKDGLFCERIFGPTKDWECYCGKYKRIRYKGVVCDKCGVEVTLSRVRRERMGHITLAAPVAHIWYFKGSPPKLSVLLDIPPRSLESVIYFAQYLVTEVDEEKQKEALKKVGEILAKNKKELKEKLNKEIEKLKLEEEKEKKETERKIKNKDQRNLALEEIKLKFKQKIQTLKDNNLLELQKLEEDHQLLTDLIRRIKKFSLVSEEEYVRLEEYELNGFFKAGMGAEVILEVLEKLDLEKLAGELKEKLRHVKGEKYLKIAKRLKLIESLRRAGVDPSWMILRVLPVIPPDLRPMVQLSGGKFASSDLNDLYRRVINRNNRLKHLISLGAPEIIIRNEKRMLQEAVDFLIDSAKKGTRRVMRGRQPLRSLSDMLRGKQGRFRQNLLGKRVDYSGRSVIVVGPELKLTQCGLPKEMALELFKPFILRELILAGLAQNVKNAKYILEHRPPEVYDILERITKNHPVLLNRAPTLHKLGIQAFYPVLIDGRAIQIHPCVCAGYNADFDGDQMAVHVPLSKEAIKEAEELMTPKSNLLRPADGSPITVPGKEMALGCYFITSIDPKLSPCKTIFVDFDEAILAYQVGKIELRQLIKVREPKERKIIETTVGRILFNRVLPEGMPFINEGIQEKRIKALVTQALEICDNERIVQLIDDLKQLGFWGATISGLSVGIWDCVVYPGKEKIIDEANEKATEIEENYKQGLITLQEKKRLLQKIWLETTEVLAEKTWGEFKEGNSIKLMVEAGLRRVSKDQIKQLSAMQGLIVDPLGKIVEMPIKSNFKEGLSVFEYITSARGARKGLTDTALKTSDAGYLTRRLVDAAHDVIVREEDCGTQEGIIISKEGVRGDKFFERILGRVLAEDIKIEKDKVILKKGELITRHSLELLEKHQIKEVKIRSPLTCQTKYGVCQLCYGWDLSSKKLVEIGTPVGVIAAQSIGEPGTQLTLRTKQTGGIVGLDVTQGLPRVEELFEVRTPKAVVPMAEISGRVSVKEVEGGYEIKIKNNEGQVRSYFVSSLNTLLVEDGQLVGVGTPLASGPLNIKDIVEIKGMRPAQEYLINEIQAVYESQGIPINDKHFEVIVRKMSDKLRIIDEGDTMFLPRDLVSKNAFEEENQRVIKEGKKPATAKPVILGLKRTSLYTDSWLSAASFEETTNVLADVSLENKEDKLLGLKENVIIGRLIPVTPERARIED